MEIIEGVCRRQPHAGKASTASKCSPIHGISRGKKKANHIRSTRESQRRVWELAFLVPWLLDRAGKNKKVIEKCICNQLVEGGTSKESTDPFTGSKTVRHKNRSPKLRPVRVMGCQTVQC